MLYMINDIQFLLAIHGSSSGTSQLGPSPNRRPELEQDEGDEGQEGRDESQDQTRVLTADVMEELRGEQRRDGPQGVPHEALAGDGRGRVLAVAVGGETVARLEDEEDADGDQGQGDDGPHPDQTLVLREGVDEEADGEPDGPEESAVQPGLRVDAAVVGVAGLVVFLDLEEIEPETQRGSDAERDVRQSGHALVPAALLLEGDGDDGQEEEGQEPGERDPQAEEEHHGLRHEHADRLDRRVVQHVFDPGGFEFRARDVAVVAGGLAQGLGPFVEHHAAPRLPEEDNDQDPQRDVGQALDALHPAPAEGLVDEARVDGSPHRAQNRNVRERRHGHRSLLGPVHIAKRAPDENRPDAAKQTQQGPAHHDRRDVLAQRQPDEHQREAHVSADVDDLAARQFAERRQEQRRQRTGEVEREQTQLAQLFRHAEFRTHARDPRAVRRGGQPDEQGHHAQHPAQESLLLAAPVERVLGVAGPEVQHGHLAAVVVGRVRQCQGHIDVHLLQRAMFRERRSLLVVVLLRVLASHYPAQLRALLLLLRAGMCRGIFRM